MPRGTSPLDRANIQGRLWTPNVLQEQKFAEWYAGDISTISAVTNAVDTLVDRSNKGYTGTQSTESNKPTFSKTSFMNKEGISFDAGDTLPLASNPASATCSCVAVIYPTSVTGNQFIASMGGSGLATAGSSICTNILASNKWGAYAGSSTTYRSANTTLSANTPYILVMDGTGASLDGGTFWLNGVSDGTYSTIGSSSSVSGSYVSAKGAILRYLLWANVALNDRLRNLIEGWVAWDSGIVDQCLPITHPFKNCPPMIGD